jgi:hypothetical protein
MQMGVPKGFWTVFDKCSNILILVEQDLGMPIDQYDLLDGSIGKRWSWFRQDRPWIGKRISYSHIFPDKRGMQTAWAYPSKELAYFDQWLQFQYIPDHLPEYLASKYPIGDAEKTFLKDLAERRFTEGGLPRPTSIN